jgi:general secretion pathway protein A
MYLKHFGFREAPFNLTPDPKFFYSSELHREALAALYYGIKSKKGFIVVTGEVGTGKTTVLRKLLQSLEATHHSVYIFNTLLTFDELLDYAVRDLGLEPARAGRAALVQQLNEFLLEKTKMGHIVSLLIDEAQQLNEEALEAIRFLSNLETDREKLLQIILVGQPELETKLNSFSLRQLKQRVSLWSRLDRLSVKDTETYIRHRLEVAGYQGPDIFEAPSIRLVTEYSSGTPRLINSICDNALLTAFAMSKKIVSGQIVQEVVRDLRLIPEPETTDVFAPGQKIAGQSQPTPLRNAAEYGAGKGAARTESAGRSKTAHTTLPSQDSDGVHDFGSKPTVSQVSGILTEPEIKRQPARNLANVAEFKDRRTKDRERIGSEEISISQAALANGDFIASGYKSTQRPTGNAVVPIEFFTKVSQSLTNAMGPMAPHVLQEQIAKLGESSDQFAVSRLPELVEAIKREILSEDFQQQFEDEIAKQIQEYSTALVRRSRAS